MRSKIKIHDGIVGTLILTSIVMGFWVNPGWFYVAGGVGALMISSTFTGFCPVYFVLNRVMSSQREEEVG